jgi:hypothetical protein
MPQGGVSARPERRYAQPWWEELDREAFRFPAAREVRETAAVAEAVPAARVGGERRTVTIRGHGAERNLPVARPTLRRHERPGFRPDRVAMWAVLLGLCLILVAVASAHGAVLH